MLDIIKGRYLLLYGSQKPVFWSLQTTKGADQAVHPHSLISTFDIHFFGKYLSRQATSEISIVLASLCSWFESHFVGNPKGRFSQVFSLFCPCLLLSADCLFTQHITCCAVLLEVSMVLVLCIQ